MSTLNLYNLWWDYRVWCKNDQEYDEDSFADFMHWIGIYKSELLEQGETK